MAKRAVPERPGRQARPRRSRVRWTAAVAFVLFLIGGYFGISAFVADRVSRPKRKALVSTPAEYGLEYEDVTFPSTVDNIPLRGWLIGSPGDKAIIMMHGRDQNRESDEAYLEKASRLAGAGYDVLMFDFRAHGTSGGERYAFGQWETRDVAGALRYLESRGYTKFGTYADSMGAAISLLAAPDHPEMQALWVDSPFADLRPLIEQRLPEDSGLPTFFNPGILFMGKVLYGYDLASLKPAEAVARLGDRPLYHVHIQEGDDWVPMCQALDINSAAKCNRNFTWWAAPGRGHVNAYTSNKEEYTRRMLSFYDKYLR